MSLEKTTKVKQVIFNVDANTLEVAEETTVIDGGTGELVASRTEIRTISNSDVMSVSELSAEIDGALILQITQLQSELSNVQLTREQLRTERDQYKSDRDGLLGRGVA